MSFWEDLGDFLDAAKDTTVSAANLSWDLATAPITTNPFMNSPGEARAEIREGFGNTVEDLSRTYRETKRPAMAALSTVFEMPVIKQGAEGMYWAYSNVVSQPLTTALLAGAPGSDQFGDVGEAWKQAENISPGQALLANNNTSVASRFFYDNVFNDEQRRVADEYFPWMNGDFDITAEADRKAAFEDSFFGKTVSGGLDTTVGWYADPTKGLGKVLGKGYRAATTLDTQNNLARLADDIAKHDEFLQSGGAAGQKTGLGTLVEDSTKMTAWQIKNDKRFVGTLPEGVASLLGQSDDFATNALIIRASSGDSAAMGALREWSASTWDAVGTARNGMEATQLRFLSKVDEPAKLIDDQGNLRLDWDYDNVPGLADDVDLYNEYKAIHDDLIQQDEFLKGAIDEASQIPIQALRAKGTSLSTLRGASAVARADRKISKTGMWSDQTVSGFGKRAVRVISWLGDETPSGWVSIKGGSATDSSREVAAALSKVKAWGDDAGRAKKEYWINRYIDSKSQQERMTTLLAMEQDVMYDVGRRALGVGDDLADNAAVTEFIETIYDQHKRARTRAAEHLSKRTFMVDSDGTMIKAPQFESQLADAVPLADFRMYEDLLSRHSSAMRDFVGHSKDLLLSGYDLFASVWRPLTLLRLGYTQRNVGEGWLRTMAYFDGLMDVDPKLLGKHSIAYRLGSNMNTRMTSMNYRIFGGKRSMGELIDEAEVLRSRRGSLEQGLRDMELDEKVVTRSYKRAAGPAAMRQEDYYAGMADPANKTLQPRPLQQADVEMAVASPSQSLLGTRERTRYFELKEKAAPTFAEVQELTALERKATARWANQQKKAGYRLAYTDESGRLVYADKVSDIPDSALGAPIPGNPAPRSVVLVPKHERLVKEAQGRSEVLPDEVLADYPRLAPEATYDEYIKQYSQASLEVRQEMIDEILALDARLDEITSLTKRVNETVSRRRKSGEGTFRVGEHDVPDAFAGEAGRAARISSSSNPRQELEIFGPASRLTKRRAAAGQWIRVAPGAKTYWDDLAKVVNNQFRNSQMVMRILRGEPLEDVASWLARSREGKDVLRAAGVKADDAYQHVQSVANMVERYLPDPVVRARVLDGEIPATELKAALAGNPRLAQIHGEEVAKIDVSLTAGWNKITEKGFKFLGTIPEDVAVRHPFYRQVYQAELRRTINLTEAQGVALTQADLDQLIKGAHARALKETKSTLYTIERFSNAASAMRFFMPFFASWENSMRTWMGLAKSNGGVIPSAMIAWYAPNRAGWVTDGNGNPVGIGETSETGDEVLTMQIPTKGLPGWIAKGVESMNSMQVNKQSFNLILQGEPAYAPGFGPVVQIPLSEVAKRKPGFGQLMQDMKMLPFGPSEKFASWDMAAPAWMRRAFSRLQGEDDVTYANSMALIMATERMRWRNGLRETAPTMAEVEERANRLFEVRMVSNLLLPFAPTFESPYQFYFDEYRKIRAEYGEDADAVFLDRYPEHYEAMMSLSKNPTGAWATVESAERSQKYADLVAELGELDPGLVAMVVNSGEYDPNAFSDSAQAFQYTHTLGPGSTQRFRETQSPEEALKTVDIKKGWTEYIQLRNQIDAVMETRGLTSLQQTEAADLAAALSFWVQSQAEENSAWWYDYNERDSAQYAKNVQGLQSIVSNDQFMDENGDDPKWVAVQQYLEARAVFQQELFSRDAAGGSASLDAQTNADLAAAWQYFTRGLVSSSTEFGDLYNRYLENDTLGVVPSGD